MSDDDTPAAREQLLAAGFIITWDHDFIHLWCPQCPDSERAVEVFPGNPTDLAEILNAAIAHRVVEHDGPRP